MATSLVRIEVPNALNVEVSEERLTVELSDGRTLSVPWSGFPAWYMLPPQSEPTGNSL